VFKVLRGLPKQNGPKQSLRRLLAGIIRFRLCNHSQSVVISIDHSSAGAIELLDLARVSLHANTYVCKPTRTQGTRGCRMADSVSQVISTALDPVGCNQPSAASSLQVDQVDQAQYKLQ
jgi:hypothetical protein